MMVLCQYAVEKTSYVSFNFNAAFNLIMFTIFYIGIQPFFVSKVYNEMNIVIIIKKRETIWILIQKEIYLTIPYTFVFEINKVNAL